MALQAFPVSLSFAQAPSDRDEQTLARYTEVLFKDPLRQGVFEKTIKLYQSGEGVEKLRAEAEARVAASPDDPNPLVVLARLHETQMRVTDAVKCYEAALTRKPQDSRLRLRLADLLAQQDRFEKAHAEYATALEGLADPLERSATFKRIGMLYMRQGDKNKAVAAWAQMAHVQPQSDLAHLELAQIYEEHEFFDQAIAAHQQIVALSANNPYRQCQSWRSVGLIQLKQGKRREAVASLEKALTLAAPGNWLHDDLWRRIASAYLDAGDAEGLIAYLHGKLTGRPTDVLIRELLVDAYLWKGQAAEADKQVAHIVAQANGRVETYEKAIRLYERTRNAPETRALWENLVALNPKNMEYCRGLGEACLRLGDKAGAVKAWRRIADVDPADATRASLLAEIFWKHDLRAEAVAELQRLAAAQPRLVEPRLRLGEMILQAGDQAQARTAWLKIAEETDAPSDLLRIAQVLEDHQLAADAVPLMQKALRQDEGNLEIRRSLGKLLLRQKRHNEALTQFEGLRRSGVEAYVEEAEDQILDIYAAQGVLGAKIEEVAEKCKAQKENAELATWLARLLYKARDFDLAFEHLQRAHALRPEDMRLPRLLAKWYEEQHRLKLAVEQYRNLAQADTPRASEYYRKLSRLCIRVHDVPGAIEAASHVARLRPLDPQAFLELAKIQAELGRFDEAERSFRQAIRVAPDAPEARREFGDALRSAGRLGEAANEYRLMMEFGPDVETKMAGVRRLIEIYGEMGKLGDLAQELQTRIRRSPGEACLHYGLAAVYRTSLETEKELTAYKDALRSLGNDKTILKELFIASYEGGDMAEAIEYARRYTETGGDWSAQERAKVGQAHLEMGDVSRAVEVWQGMVEPSTADAKSYQELAEVMRAGGLYQEAAAMLGKAVELDREDFRTRFDYASALAVAGQVEKAAREFLGLFEMPTPSKLTGVPTVKPLSGKRLRLSRNGHGRYYLVRVEARGGDGDEQAVVSASGTTASSIEDEIRSFQTQRVVAFQRLLELSRLAGRLDAPIRHFESKLQQKEDLETLECLGELYSAANEMEKCIAVCERILVLRPGHVEARELLVAKCADMGNFAKAITHCRELVRRNPGWEGGYVLKLVDLCLDAGQVEAAMALVKERVSRGVAEPELACELGLRLVLRGPEVSAAEVFDALKPTLVNMPLVMRAADAYIWAGQLDEATRVLWDYLAGTRRGTRLSKEGLDEESRPFLPPDSFGPKTLNERTRLMLEARMGDHPTLNVAPFVANLPGLWAVTSRFEGERLGALLKLAAIYAGRGKLPELLRELEEQTRGPGDRFDAVIASAYVRAYDGDVRGAVDLLAEWLVRSPGEADVRSLYLYLAQRAENPRRLAEIYSSLPVSVIPRRYVHQALLTCYVNAGMKREAREAADTVASDGFPAQELMAMAMDIAQKGEVDVALQVVSRLQDLNMEDREGALALADVLAARGRMAEAVELCEMMLESDAEMGVSQQRGGGPSNLFSPERMQRQRALARLASFHQRDGTLDALLARLRAPGEGRLATESRLLDLATAYDGAGRVAEAAHLYHKLMAAYPHRVEPRLALARLYLSRGNCDAAVKAWAAIVRLNPENVREVREGLLSVCDVCDLTPALARLCEVAAAREGDPAVYAAFARKLEERGALDGALRMWRAAALLEPESVTHRGSLSSAYSALRQHDEAVAEAERVVAMVVTGRGGVMPMGVADGVVSVYQAAGKLGQLKQLVSDYLKRLPENINLQLLSGLVMVAERNPYGAGVLMKLAKGDPNWGELIERLTSVYEAEGELGRAVSLCANSMMRQPVNWGKYGRLGELLMKAGEKAGAVSAWRKLAWGEPPDAGPEALMRRLVEHGLLLESARAYAMVTGGNVSRETRVTLGRGFVELTRRVERGVAESPQPQSWYALGEAWRALGDLDRAETAFQKAVQLNPKDIQLYEGLSQVQVERGAHEKAVDTWARAAAANPTSDVYYRLFESCIAADAFDSLTAHWRRLALSPDGRRLAQELQSRLVSLCAERQQTDMLLDSLRDEVKRDPSWGIGLYRLAAEAHANAGDVVRAIEVCKEGLTMAAKDEGLRLALARLYAQRGQLEAAAAQYEALIALDPKKRDYVARLSELLLSSGKRDEAIRLWKRMAKTSSDGVADCLVGDLCLEAGQTGEAMSAYLHVVKGRGFPFETRARAQFGVARCLAAMGRPGAAVAEYHRVGEMFPGTTWVAKVPDFGLQGTLAATLSEHPQGVLVVEVADRSDAAHDGLRPGDIILKVDGEKLRTQDPLGLIQWVGRKKPGEKVALTVRRGARATALHVTLAPTRSE